MSVELETTGLEQIEMVARVVEGYLGPQARWLLAVFESLDDRDRELLLDVSARFLAASDTFPSTEEEAQRRLALFGSAPCASPEQQTPSL